MLAEIWCWFDIRAIDGKKLPVSQVSPVNPWMQQQTPASQVPPFLHFGSLLFPHNANKNQSRLKPYIQNYLQAPVACVPCSITHGFRRMALCSQVYIDKSPGCMLLRNPCFCSQWCHTKLKRNGRKNTRFYRTQIDKNRTLSDYFHLPISHRAPV